MPIAFAFACSDGSVANRTSSVSLDEDAGIVAADIVDAPLGAASDNDRIRFRRGDALFDQVLRPADGLGPLFIRDSCSSCHARGGRGPGIVQKVAIVGADGVTPNPDESLLPYGPTLRPYVTAGATHPIIAPSRADAKVTIRAAVPVLGRGYLEAVMDSEILRLEAEQKVRTDGVHGRAHRLNGASGPLSGAGQSPEPGNTGAIGRFGLKARLATLAEFTADAFQGDMGISSPLRPVELPNPDGLLDDDKPGVDVDSDRVDALADYMRLLEIPRREISVSGAALFESTGCAVCHAPALRTSSDYSIAALADIDAPVFTDFLLHDMGDQLSDGQTDSGAGFREWRTAPLIGVRYARTYLHDGRARSVEEAIILHGASGSEAESSVANFRALPSDVRASLVAYVEGL